MDKEKAREFINLVHRGRPVVAVTTPAALSSGRFTLVRADDYDRMEKIAEKDGGRLICFCAQVKPETLPDAGADCRRQINMSDDSIKKIFEDGCSDWIPITVNGIDFDSSKRAGNVICHRLAEMGLKNPVVYAAGTACVALYRFDDFAPANNFMTTLRLYFPAVAGGTMYDFMRPIPVPGTAGVSGIAHGKLIGINDTTVIRDSQSCIGQIIISRRVRFRPKQIALCVQLGEERVTHVGVVEITDFASPLGGCCTLVGLTIKIQPHLCGTGCLIHT